jgi:hypothetical protein
MGQALVTNNAFSTLASNITAIATTLTVSAGTGVRFPTIALGSGDYFYLSLINTSTQIEVVKVITTATDVFTVLRGQDGTTARAYIATDRVELRPTAGLLNDKVSVGGGTLTGHLNTIAAASGTQVPQVQEVVKKSGDTMTGTLTIPSLRGSTSGNIVTIPSGHIIKGTDSGSIVQPGAIIQTVYLRSDVKATYTAPAPVVGIGSETEIDELTLAITPKYNTSKILLSYMLTYETIEDTVFRLSRNGSIIGRNSTDLNYWAGTAVPPNDGNGSTPTTQTFFYLDSPASTSSLTYRVLFGSSRLGVTRDFYLNRSINNAGSSQYEVGISQVLIQEIAQ